MDLNKLIELHPRFFHMAEAGTWPLIKSQGLLSTRALLDNAGLKGVARAVYEDHHRTTKMTAGPSGPLLRDQKPMSPKRLAGALTGGATPQQWYRLLNGMVFMWASEERLYRLLGARDYRTLEHDVLTVDARAFLAVHAPRTWLCHMNSGNTFPVAQPRGIDLFKRIAEYPVTRTGRPRKPIVEVVVDYGISDIVKYVVKVQRIRNDQIVKELPL